MAKRKTQRSRKIHSSETGPAMAQTPQGLVPAPEIAKTSALLLQLVEPLMGAAQTREQAKKLVAAALVAWNESIDEANGIPRVPDAVLDHPDVRPVVEQLKARKRRLFPTNHRRLLSLSFTDTPNGMGVNVTSEPPPGFDLPKR